MSGSDPLWRQCAVWLDKLRLIPARHPSLKPHSRPQDLLNLLRNGVILCQAAHSLDPNSIDLTKVVYSPPEDDSVEDFVCRNNIFLFLRSVVTHFDLEESFFFDPTCLYQYQDVGKVFRTLSALSWTPAAAKFNIPGFPKKEKKLERRLESEEGLYDELRQLYDRGETETAEIENAGDYEEIYQSVVSPNKPRRTRSFISTRRSKREYPIKEFLETEENYLGNLLMVRDFFRDQIKQFSPELKSLIFKNLDEMILLHSTILQELRESKNDVGKVLMKNFSMFSIYREYCVGLSRVQTIIQNEELRNPELKQELQECRLRSKSSFPLSAHVVIPFQRLLKYHLMLGEILKFTEETHPQFFNLQLSQQAFTEFNLEINEMKRSEEQDESQVSQDTKDLQILEKVERSIKSMNLPSWSKLKDYGRLVRAGDLCGYGNQGEAEYAFLLQTIIIFCSKPRILQHRFRFKFALKLKDYDIVNGGDHIRMQSKMNLTPPLVLTCKGKHDIRVWYRDLEMCRNLLSPADQRGHTLVLTSMPGQTCTHCDTKLLGLIGQGYRCRTCLKVLHLNCYQETSCSVLEHGVEFRRTGSIVLPTLSDRGSMGSTLSLAMVQRDNSEQVRQLQAEWAEESSNLPLEYQAWYAGRISLETGTDRLKSLPVGTFLVRQRGPGQDFALDIKTTEGVKHLKIFCEQDQHNCEKFSFSQARSFQSISELIGYYRTNDLLENFSYKHMIGVKLALPYKNA